MIPLFWLLFSKNAPYFGACCGGCLEGAEFVFHYGSYYIGTSCVCVGTEPGHGHHARAGCWVNCRHVSNIAPNYNVDHSVMPRATHTRTHTHVLVHTQNIDSGVVCQLEVVNYLSSQLFRFTVLSFHIFPLSVLSNTVDDGLLYSRLIL